MIVYEQGKRRAEVRDKLVLYMRKTGAKGRGLVGVWYHVCDDEREAKRLAQKWAFKGKLSALA